MTTSTTDQLIEGPYDPRIDHLAAEAEAKVTTRVAELEDEGFGDSVYATLTVVLDPTGEHANSDELQTAAKNIKDAMLYMVANREIRRENAAS
jgi:hypothetical protein